LRGTTVAIVDMLYYYAIVHMTRNVTHEMHETPAPGLECSSADPSDVHSSTGLLRDVGARLRDLLEGLQGHRCRQFSVFHTTCSG
jgi:hypothetical protein